MRLTSKGQVTVPQAIRQELGLLPGTAVEFEMQGNAVLIRKAAHPSRPSRGRSIVEHARGRGNRRFTTEQLMRLMRD